MSAQPAYNPAPMQFTGERMVPHASDPATELFHWQRYLFFRPWYDGKRVVDAASGEGYGANYAANFASSAIGLDISEEAVTHANRRYSSSPDRFLAADVCQFDFSSADLVVSFETIEHLSDPELFLRALCACPGQIVISTPNRNAHSPGNKLEDGPFNEFHTIEWTPSEFAGLIEKHFPNRRIRFLSQQALWPGTIREGLDEGAAYVIAVIGDGELPIWPKLGISVPTHNGSSRCQELVVGMTRYYPGDIEFAIVDNGSVAGEAEVLRTLEQDFPAHVRIIRSEDNLGYGRGANAGLEYLSSKGGFEYFAVSNDDVRPAVDCLSELVVAMQELEAGGHNPGVIGPVTNEISGAQKVDIGPYRSYAEMIERAEAWHGAHHSSVSQASQLRGLFMLIHPGCLEAVGGFDPRFGIGNFEDDDHNLRCRLAGYSLWIADGAFLHHAGSSTFSEMKVDYQANIERNLHLMMEKWGLSSFDEILTLENAPEGVALRMPLCAEPATSGHVVYLNGETVDLVHQASDVEFAAFLFSRLQGRPRSDRLAILATLDRAS